MNRKMLWVVVVVGIGVAVWFAWGHSGSSLSGQPSQSQSDNKAKDSSTSTAQAAADAGNVVSGILKASNYPSHGNLMLVTDKQTIYLHTSRDFSALVGKEVNVSFDGDLKNFTLIDIQAK